jgi:hypothetical protein
MLTPGELDNVFQMYWDDMERCRTGRAYWSLLHVTVCLPDICAALESVDGRTLGRLYIAWCDTYLSDALLTAEERYACAVRFCTRVVPTWGSKAATPVRLYAASG